VNILFVHQNFPAQFRHLAPALAARGHRVVAMGVMPGPARDWPARDWQGVRVHPVAARRGSTRGIHPWLIDLETKTIRGEACFYAARALLADGFAPDVIIAHPGWGESLFLRHVWPQARLGLYCEFHYRAQGADTGFDPELGPPDPAGVCRTQLRNLNNQMHFEWASAGISPTPWQAGGFPAPFRDRITVVHDGIDTDALAPAGDASFVLPDGRRLDRNSEVITYVSRNLEPYRGFHVFARALPAILAGRPAARVVIVGGDGAGYGPPAPAEGWKAHYLAPVQAAAPDADWSRVHFCGRLAYADYVQLLRVSRVHAYLTYPFVLSWSLLEAMSLGCAIVASDTPPVRDALTDGDTGWLVDFFDADALARRVCDLAAAPDAAAQLGARARQWARAHVDLARICLPRQLQWVEALA
jgi:glycosyltransferase involved in cell wall biosynthesis